VEPEDEERSAEKKKKRKAGTKLRRNRSDYVTFISPLQVGSCKRRGKEQ